ncbi:MAG TPA: hypothetical protein PKY59_24015 [Pyrinomonadaceae bacterium]|nr:hypothetical protein [Pyrinomonadaceae bacterium]
MKVFCFIFIIYILVLSLTPCDEMLANAEFTNNEISKQKAFSENSDSEKNGDECSPFCICSCCHFSTAYQLKSFTITNKVIVAGIFSTENSYKNPYTKEYKTSVWQPPKFNSIG